MDTTAAAEKLESQLGLDSPPIGIAFVDGQPPGVESFQGSVPSSCTFWRKGETGVFYAPADAHFGCAVGAMVMGFSIPDSVEEQLMDTVGRMLGCSYISADEPAALPKVGKPKTGIVYGRLADFPLDPDLILLWLTPMQAMLFSEGAGNVDWTGVENTVFGRPACAALPIAMQGSRPTLSLGCVGMRTFTEVSEDRLLAVVPASGVGNFVAALEGALEANQEMASFYQQRKVEVSA
jgi:uncharacterized protein (DUF169 family)